jgi:hypothetical protein
MILKWILKKWWAGFLWFGGLFIERCREHGDEPPVNIKDMGFLDWLSDYQLFEKDPAS